MWHSWPSKEAFDEWHAAANTALGIPHPNVNAATGVVDDDATWTTEYTAVIEVGPTDWRAVVESDAALLVPYGLGTPCVPPFEDADEG